MKKIIFILMCLFPIFVVFVAKDILLEFAAKNNFTPMAKFCLFIGANANSKYYPLTAAVKNNYIQMADLLIKKGANINIEDKNIATPLETAVTNDNIDIAYLLFKNGATAGNNSKKLLEIAVKNDSTNMVSLLLEKGASIDNNGKKLLEIAVKNDSTNMVDLLLENGADLKITNGYVTNPLEIAVIKNNVNMVKLLLEKGADPNIKNKYSETPIWENYLQYDCTDNKVRKELLAAGAKDTICSIWKKVEIYMNKHQFKSARKVINDNSGTLGKAKDVLIEKINADPNYIEYIKTQINEYIGKHQFQSARKLLEDNPQKNEYSNRVLFTNINKAEEKYEKYKEEIDMQRKAQALQRELEEKKEVETCVEYQILLSNNAEYYKYPKKKILEAQEFYNNNNCAYVIYKYRVKTEMKKQEIARANGWY